MSAELASAVPDQRMKGQANSQVSNGPKEHQVQQQQQHHHHQQQQSDHASEETNFDSWRGGNNTQHHSNYPIGTGEPYPYYPSTSFQYQTFGAGDGTWSNGTDPVAFLSGYGGQISHDAYGMDQMFSTGAAGGFSGFGQPTFNYFPAGNGDFNAWGTPRKARYEDYYPQPRSNESYQTTAGNNEMKAIDQGVQGLSIGGEIPRHDQSMSTQLSKPEPKEQRKITWASVASQPAKPVPPVLVNQGMKKKAGMPPPPIIPGKHNMDIGTWGDGKSTTPPKVPLPPQIQPPVPTPPPPIIQRQRSTQPPRWKRASSPSLSPVPTQPIHVQTQQPQHQMSQRQPSPPQQQPVQQYPSQSHHQTHHQSQQNHHHDQHYQHQPQSASKQYRNRQQTQEHNLHSQPQPQQQPQHQQQQPQQQQQQPQPQQQQQQQQQPKQQQHPQQQQQQQQPQSQSQQQQPQQQDATPPQSISHPVLDELKVKNDYNPHEFDQTAPGARFFVIKSYSEDDIHRSIKYEIWCSTEHGNKRLDQAYKEASREGAPLYLFFSVNGSGHFCGMARMVSSVDYQSNSSVWSQDKWKGQFRVRWIYVKDVPNTQLRHIILENNENRPVTNSRDAQEVPHAKGVHVLRILHTYRHSTSIFDDFGHYEKRQAEEHQRKGPPMGAIQHHQQHHQHHQHHHQQHHQQQQQQHRPHSPPSSYRGRPHSNDLGRDHLHHQSSHPHQRRERDGRGRGRVPRQ